MQIATGEFTGHTSEYPLSRLGNRDEILFLDIETTGLSPEQEKIYLIGCAYWEEDNWKMIQWFDETGLCEGDILTSFLLFSKPYRVLVQYNGEKFALPFLSRRIVWNGLQGVTGLETFPDYMRSIDLYQYIKPYKKLLSLADLKASTLEKFVGIERAQTLSGKDLKNLYRDYLNASAETEKKTQEEDKEPDQEAKPEASPTTIFDTLLAEFDAAKAREAAIAAGKEENALPSAAPVPALPPTKGLLRAKLFEHNRLDLQGLIAICDIFSLTDLFTANLNVYKAQANTYRDAEGEPAQELIMFARAEGIPEDVVLPGQENDAGVITTHEDGCFLTIRGAKVTIKVPIYNGRIHYYYANYRDYYFLPELDQAVHKSIASFVDPSRREQATPQTCYTAKVGAFLPEWTPFREPFFKREYEEKGAWFEFKPEMKKDKGFFTEYANYVYQHVLRGKST